MDMSTSITKLAEALAKAQPLIEGAAKDKNNPAFRSKYADLGAVVDAIRPALSQHGLSFIQVIHDADNAVRVETIIMHASGEWLSTGCVMIPVVKHDAHGYGSALTYARRYGLSAAFGVAPEDDDGNAAAKTLPSAPMKVTLPKYTQEQIDSNVDTWRASFTAGKSSPDSMIAKISSKYTLSDDMKQAIRDLEQPPLTTQIDSVTTFAQVAEALNAAGDVETLDLRANLIHQVSDSGQRGELNQIFLALRAKLEN